MFSHMCGRKVHLARLGGRHDGTLPPHPPSGTRGPPGVGHSIGDRRVVGPFARLASRHHLARSRLVSLNEPGYRSETRIKHIRDATFHANSHYLVL